MQTPLSLTHVLMQAESKAVPGPSVWQDPGMGHPLLLEVCSYNSLSWEGCVLQGCGLKRLLDTQRGSLGLAEDVRGRWKGMIHFIPRGISEVQSLPNDSQKAQ